MAGLQDPIAARLQAKQQQDRIHDRRETAENKGTPWWFGPDSSSKPVELAQDKLPQLPDINDGWMGPKKWHATKGKATIKTTARTPLYREGMPAKLDHQLPDLGMELVRWPQVILPGLCARVDGDPTGIEHPLRAYHFYSTHCMAESSQHGGRRAASKKHKVRCACCFRIFCADKLDGLFLDKPHLKQPYIRPGKGGYLWPWYPSCRMEKELSSNPYAAEDDVVNFWFKCGLCVNNFVSDPLCQPPPTKVGKDGSGNPKKNPLDEEMFEGDFSDEALDVYKRSNPGIDFVVDSRHWFRLHYDTLNALFLAAKHVGPEWFNFPFVSHRSAGKFLDEMLIRAKRPLNVSEDQTKHLIKHFADADALWGEDLDNDTEEMMPNSCGTIYNNIYNSVKAPGSACLDAGTKLRSLVGMKKPVSQILAFLRDVRKPPRSSGSAVLDGTDKAKAERDARELLKRPKLEDVVNEPGREKWETSVHLAAIKGLPDVLAVLLCNGGNANKLNCDFLLPIDICRGIRNYDKSVWSHYMMEPIGAAEEKAYDNCILLLRAYSFATGFSKSQVEKVDGVWMVKADGVAKKGESNEDRMERVNEEIKLLTDLKGDLHETPDKLAKALYKTTENVRPTKREMRDLRLLCEDLGISAAAAGGGAGDGANANPAMATLERLIGVVPEQLPINTTQMGDRTNGVPVSTLTPRKKGGGSGRSSAMATPRGGGPPSLPAATSVTLPYVSAQVTPRSPRGTRIFVATDAPGSYRKAMIVPPRSSGLPEMDMQAFVSDLSRKLKLTGAVRCLQLRGASSSSREAPVEYLPSDPALLDGLSDGDHVVVCSEPFLVHVIFESARGAPPQPLELPSEGCSWQAFLSLAHGMSSSTDRPDRVFTVDPQSKQPFAEVEDVSEFLPGETLMFCAKEPQTSRTSPPPAGRSSSKVSAATAEAASSCLEDLSESEDEDADEIRSNKKIHGQKAAEDDLYENDDFD